MNNQGNNIMRNVITQLTGNLTDAGFTALVTAYNLPAGLTLGAAQAIVKGTMQAVMQNCYDDVQSRALSKREVVKHNMVFDIAERTYFELAANDKGNVPSQDVVLEDSYFQQVYETAEHVSIEAIRQSEMKKIEVLGRYYGGEFYKHGPNIDFQDMHQMIAMAGSLTFRQIVLIRLIKEEFKNVNENHFISNPYACVEVNRLRDYGIWQTEGASFGINESRPIQLKSIRPTIYAEKVSDALMLDRLSDDDVQRTLESLRLTLEGTPQEVLTQDDYKAATTWQYDEDEEKVSVGARYQAVRDAATMPDDMTCLLRGKDLMREASDYDNRGNMIHAVDCTIRAIEEYKRCKSEKLFQPAIEDALNVLKGYFVQSQNDGGVRIQRGMRQAYEAVLGDIKGELLQECRDFLDKAVDRDDEFEEELKKNAIKSMFHKGENEDGTGE